MCAQESLPQRPDKNYYSTLLSARRQYLTILEWQVIQDYKILKSILMLIAMKLKRNDSEDLCGPMSIAA